MIGNLIFGSYIFLKLLIPMNIRGGFIISFYAVSFVMTMLRMIEVSYGFQDPNTQDWEYGYNDMTFYRIIAITATLSSFSLGLLIIGTMYQIALSIRIMVGDVEV